MHKIGFIDEDESQRNFFYQTFKNDFEVYKFELTDDRKAEELIKETFDNNLDALVIDYKLDTFFDFNGDKIVEILNKINHFFPKVILTSHPFQALDFVDDTNLVNTKDVWSGDSPNDLAVFIKKLNRSINIYREKIKDSEEQLKLLEEKRTISSLDKNEEEKYIELNKFLSKTVGERKDLPRTLYSQETNKKLDSLIEKTQQVLNKLSEK